MDLTSVSFDDQSCMTSSVTSNLRQRPMAPRVHRLKKLWGHKGELAPAVRYPPFNSLTPRQKAESPRIPGALYKMYKYPEVAESDVRKWMASLPHNEQELRRALRTQLPGAGGGGGSSASGCSPPLSARSGAASSSASGVSFGEEPEERLLQRRQEQAAKLEELVRKVRPSVGTDSDLIRSGMVRLQKLREPLPVISQAMNAVQEEQTAEQHSEEEGDAGGLDNTPVRNEVENKATQDEDWQWKATAREISVPAGGRKQ
ncbi:unnamed protein product [Polarella glacialis]|uniref:Uncharacterized protein n=1 Tax=Polarella glacialis TaxID=89957 RepID=A0A813KQU4_POLGL|nr:unnamed protein product [Polarella glacialis]